jgi:choline-sulfatase
MWSASRRLAFACAMALVHPGCSRPQHAPEPRPLNVLLITIDTFRADRLGTGIAPSLDRLAESSVRFTSARATVPLTLPSHATILTGLLPPGHGVRENGLEALSDVHPTIATLLKRAGYQTAAFVGAFVLDRRFGLGQGFDSYDDQVPRDPAATERLEAERPAQVVVDHALAWLNAHVTSPAPPAPAALPAPPAPFFVWLHLYDPHAPYAPPAEFRAKTRSAYDGEIAYVDAQVARVLDWMGARALTDRSLIVVAGDHGEGLGDHGERTHGMLLYDSTLRVPLLLAAPDRAPSQRDEAVSLRDVAPTILRAVGVAPPAGMEGRDLLAAAERGHSVQREGRQLDLYAETEYPRVAGWASLQALTDGRWKTIRAGAVSEVYDLQHDPTETRDVARTEQAVAAAMASTIDRIHATSRAPTDRVVSGEAQERLRTLGYVASSTQSLQTPGAANPATKIDAWNAFEDALAGANDRRPEAVTALKKLALENPEAGVFQTTYARALKDAGQPDRALLIYRGAAKRWPSDATLLHDLAVAARDAAAQARGSAADALRKEAAGADAAAVALAPTNAMAHNGLGLLAVDEHRLHDAIAEFQRATAIDATNASYWANLGNARRGSGDRAGAEQAYRRAIEIDPRTVDAANGLGVLLVEAQRPSEAVAWLERATAAAPDFVEARLNLGIALQQAGHPDRAAQVYRSVLEAPPRYRREREAAAKLLASLGAAR